jgi:hypothetical protein
MDEFQLRNVWQNRQRPDRTAPLSEPLNRIMNRRLAKRVRQLGAISAAWDEVIPEFLRERSALVTYQRGTLTVAVDSAAHRYQLQVLLDSGLTQALRERIRNGPLNRVRLVPGNYDVLEFPDDRPF